MHIRATLKVTSPTTYVNLGKKQFNVFCKIAESNHGTLWYIRSHIQLSGNPTRLGTSSKLVHPVHAKALQSSHHHFYFNRIVSLWNHLPEIQTSFSINTIKNQLTVYLWNHFTTNFNSDSLCSYHILCPCYWCSRQPVSVIF